MSESHADFLNSNHIELSSKIAEIPGVSRIISAGSMSKRDTLLVIFDTSEQEAGSETPTSYDQAKSSLEQALNGSVDVVFVNTAEDIASALDAEASSDLPRLIAIPDTALADHGINLRNADNTSQQRVVIIDGRSSHLRSHALSTLLAISELRTNPSSVWLPDPMDISRIHRPDRIEDAQLLKRGLAVRIAETMCPDFDLAPLIDRQPNRSYDMPWSKSPSKNKNKRPGNANNRHKGRGKKRR